MSKTEYSSLIYTACTIGWLTVVLPIVVYLSRSWRFRRQDLLEIMTDEVLRQYYKHFFPSRRVPAASLKTTFQREFDIRYGWRRYIVPVFLLCVISAAGLWSVATTLLEWVDSGLKYKRLSLTDVAVAALLGGLTWVVSDQLTRARTLDFTSHDVHNCVFRILIAILLGLSIAVFSDDKLKLAIAFLLGAFPTSTLFTIARRLGTDKLKLADDAVGNTSELEKLQSVGKAFAERLKDEGINSIGELAYTDPVSLTIRTNKPFAYVTDCISQALLWIYAKEGVERFMCCRCAALRRSIT